MQKNFKNLQKTCHKAERNLSVCHLDFFGAEQKPTKKDKKTFPVLSAVDNTVSLDLKIDCEKTLLKNKRVLQRGQTGGLVTQLKFKCKVKRPTK